MAVALVTALVIGVATALAGSGVGGVFNLGQANTVDAQTSLSGSVGSNAQLRVENGSAAANSFALFGRMTSGSAAAGSTGVRGVNASGGEDGSGVWGIHQGSGIGVLGQSPAGTGITGKHMGSSGVNPGVLGQTSSQSTGASGILGEVTPTTVGATSAAVRAFNHGTGTNGFALLASHLGNGTAIYGDTNNGTAIYGWHAASTGTKPGVHGDTDSQSTEAAGVLGTVTTAQPGRGSAGVRGENTGTPLLGVAIGVLGEANTGLGVRGQSVSGEGISGAATGTSGQNIGVHGLTESPAGYAGYFDGRVHVTGDLKVAGSYVQMPVRTGAPPGTDCNSAAEAGRVVVRTDGSVNLYVCRGFAGWIGK